MTKINKLIMHGFKSFARRTELVFSNDFNCILGPNGSGKSNVIDALCFVLGRMSAKAMRVEKAANLVYNGGKTKKAMKQAEVSIFFDNEKKTFPTQDPYVKITRLIKQNGQSTYKINDQKRTRQQILDLMAVAKIDPEGYNIVLQGDIVRFTEMRPEERRILIEEISGISVYEEKKQKALRELEKVGGKLKEAEVILAERNRYLTELKNERDQALEFKELEKKVKEDKASLVWLQKERTESRKNELQKNINVHQEKIDSIKNKTDSIKKIIEGKRQSINKINKEVEEQGEVGQVNIQKEIESLKVSIATNKTRIDTSRGEIDKIELRNQQLQKDVKDLDVQIDHLETERKEREKKQESITEQLKKINQSIDAFKEKNKLENASEIESHIDSLEKDAEEKQKTIEEHREEQQELLRKKDNLEFQINAIDEKIGKVQQLKKENLEQINQLKEDKEHFKKAIQDLNKRLNEDSILANQIVKKKQELAQAQEKLAKAKARNISIKESMLGNVAVKKILEERKNIKGIYGTIAELGNVESKYTLALEVAAGPRLNSIVVEDDNVAQKCINLLKKRKLGTATFLPLNKIKPKEAEPKKGIGIHDIAVNLISFDSKFKKVFSYVFGNTLVVEDIDTARKIGIGKTRMVTLEGDVIEASGAMQGGYRQKKRYSFNEKELQQELMNYEKQIIELEATLDALEKQRTSNEDKIVELREQKASLEGEIIKQERSLHLESGDSESDKETKESLKRSLEETNTAIQSIESKINESTKVLTDIKIKRQQMRVKIGELRNPEILAELNAYEEKKTQLKEELMHLDADKRNIDTQIKDMKQPEKEKIQAILKQQDKDSIHFAEEIAKLNQKNQKDITMLQEKEKQLQEFYSRFKQLFSKRDMIGDDIQKEESKIEAFLEQSKEIEITMNGISLKNAEVKAKLAGLEEEYKQYEGVKINKNKNEDELKQEIAKFERKVIEIGNVNMRALEVYEEILKEYESLLEKKERLSKEKEEVLEMMEEIEGKKKELFMKTFDALNENFKRIFTVLSKKGDGSLQLENPENPFEAGLNIKVRIIGKKFLDIRSLSGGEKTMTALAFIFAIQEYDPHSFYILDEVDAALDKHNSEKLAGLIKEYVKKAQYIVISHNDSVISKADNLYGVSMNEHGITNVTSLKI